MMLEEFTKTSFYKNSDFIPDFLNTADQLDNWKFLADQFANWEQNKTLQIKPLKTSIPKIIHQIWIGSPFPKKYQGWADSWKEKNSGWEYRLWTEEDILPLCNKTQKNWFCSAKNFGPKSDLARYLILEKFGGLYCDTDFECLKSFDGLITDLSFFAGTIFNAKPEIAGGIIASIPHHPLIIKTLAEILVKKTTTNKTADILNETGPAFFSRILFLHKKLWAPSDVVFPTHYLYPFPNYNVKADITEQQIKTQFIKPISYAIHYWDMSWMTKSPKWKKNIKKFIKNLIFYKYWHKD